MAEDSRFHTLNKNFAKHIQGSFKHGREDYGMTDRDEQILMKFLNEITANNNISLSRQAKVVTTLVGWRRFVGEFETNTITDIHAGIKRLSEAKTKKGTPFTQNTLRDYVRFLKRFYLWMIENGISSIPAKKITDINAPKENLMTKTAADLLSEDEVLAMVKVCTNSRDRALVMMLYEGAFRIGELGNMRWDQVKLPSDKDWMIQVNVNEKTGYPRYIPLLLTKPYLLSWRQDYPGEAEGRNFVFVTLDKKTRQMQYQTIRKLVTGLAEMAGIKKKISLHVFRHSRITELIRQGVGSEHIKKIGWGNVTTKMFSTYLHLTNDDIDKVMMGVYGIDDIKEVKKLNLRPIQCKTCNEINRPDAKFCFKCGQPLTEHAVVEQQGIIKSLDAMTPNLSPEQLAAIADLVAKKMQENAVKA
jgi:integrase/recombinase XerD